MQNPPLEKIIGPTATGESAQFEIFAPDLIRAINYGVQVVHEWQQAKGWLEKPEWRQQVESILNDVSCSFLTAEQENALKELAAMPIRNKGELIALMHSELSEQLEGQRSKVQPAMDDHCPSLTTEEAELADLIIRAFSYSGENNIDIGRAIAIKHAFNCTRAARHGKRF